MKRKERSAFLCYHDDYFVADRMLNDAQLGQLSRALYRASIGNPVDESTLDDRVQSIYLMMLIKIERDAQRYAETCERQRRNVAKRYQKADDATTSTTVYHGIPTLPKETVTPIEKEEEKEKEKVKVKVTAKEKEPQTECAPGAALVPPTPKEVEDYALSQGHRLDGQRFCDYYDARGWLVGKSPMQNWRAAVRLWIREDQQKAASPPQHTTRLVNAQKYTQRTYTEKDLTFQDSELMAMAKDRTERGVLS